MTWFLVLLAWHWIAPALPSLGWLAAACVACVAWMGSGASD
jgi:hypothetical protein